MVWLVGVWLGTYAGTGPTPVWGRLVGLEGQYFSRYDDDDDGVGFRTPRRQRPFGLADMRHILWYWERLVGVGVGTYAGIGNGWLV